MKNIENYNNKGQYHGYQEFYFAGDLIIKYFYNNGIRVDYEEQYNWGKLENKNFYI